MKKINLLWIISIILIASTNIFGQTYTYPGPAVNIPDNDPVNGGWAEINASGIVPVSEVDYVTINLTHTYDFDLEIVLEFYDNSWILSNQNGGGGDNYTNTIFRTGAYPNITSGTAPFTGTYLPETPLPKFIDNFNPNGKWTLHVYDLYGGDVGTINSWSITFKAPTCATIGFGTLPATMNCNDAAVNLSASDFITAGGADYPTLFYEFNIDATLDPTTADNTVIFYENGIQFYNQVVTTDRLTVYFTGPWVSPTAAYTMDVCNTNSTTTWLIYDGNGQTLSSGTTANTCNYGVGSCSPYGTSSWWCTPTNGLTWTGDYGYATFDPSVVGAGTYTITYNWNNQGTGGNACSGSGQHVVNVVNPWSATWNSPGTVCASGGSLNLSTYLTGSSGGTWSGTGVSGTTFNPSGLSGPINITYYVGNSAACSATVSHTITVTPAPTTATAGNDQSVCGTTATLAGNTATVGTGTWTLISGSGNISNPNSGTSGITGLGVGANVFQWTIANSPCPSSSDQVTITSVASPTVAAAGTDQSVCGTTTTLAGNTATVGTGTWTLISGSGTITNPNSGTSGITGLGAGANVFQWTIANSPCPSSSDQVTITGVASPTVANAGSDQNLCGSTSTLAGNIPTIGTGTWTLVSGSGTITNPSSATSGLTGLGIGVNVFQWTIANSPCPSSSDQVSITITSTPTIAAAGTDQSVCGTTTTLAGNTATVGTGTWTLISGSGTITNPNSETSGITGVGVGVNIFEWTISSPPCTPSSDQVTITSVASPTIANAGADQNLCGSTSTLAGNVPTIGTGTWTLISGSGTITNLSSATSGLTGLGIGVNVFQWTIANSPCSSSSDQVSITITSTPTVAAAGTDQSVCGTTVTLAGNIATGGTGTWTLVSGSGTITNPNSETSGITGLGAGANVFEWTISSPPCTPSSDQVTITGVASPTVANAGSDQNLCGSTSTLAGNVPAIGTGTWTLVSGSGTITNPSSATSGLTGLGIGVNVFQWTIDNVPCSSSSDQVSITITSTPTVAAAGTDQSVCGTTVTLAGNAATGGTGTWTLVSGSGTITSPSSATSGITGLGIGANVFEWTISSPPCTPSSDQVTITGVTPPTTANAGPDQIIGGNTATLAGNTPTNGTGTWTLVSGSGTITNPSSPTSGITNLGAGANIFEWTISNPPCASSNDMVTITSANATAQITNQTNVSCFSGSNGSVSVAMTGGTQPYTYIWSPNVSNTNTASNLIAGNYSVTITDANSISAILPIVITEPTTALSSLISGFTNVSCYSGNDGSATVTTSGGTPNYSYNWSPSGGNTSTITDLIAGNYSVTIYDANSCTSTNSVTITQPATAVSSAISTIINPTCFGGNDGSITISTSNGTPPYTYLWSNGAITQNISNINEGDYYLTVSDANNCQLIIDSTIVNPAQIIVTGLSGIGTNNLVYINITASNGTTPYAYLWSNGLVTEDLSNLNTGSYIVTITDANTCFTIDTFNIDVPLVPLEIPTAISPNNDNTNDDFEIKNIEQYTTVSLEIFNRWGDKIFLFSGSGIEYLNNSSRWDGKFKGKDLPMGGYIYILKISGLEPINGIVSIIR